VKNTQLINVEFYTGVDERLDLPVMLSPAPDAGALNGARADRRRRGRHRGHPETGP
jgi:hypothetical protein